MHKIFLTLIFPTSLLIANQEYIKISDKISDSFTRDYSKRSSLHINGCGGAMMNDIKQVFLPFAGRQQLCVAEARRLFVDGMEDALNRYNNDLIARPYLHNYPFTTDNVDFSLLFKASDGDFVAAEFVACVYCIRGKVYYSYNDRETNELMDLHEESYAEAVRIVQAERNHFSANTLQNTCNPGQVRSSRP